jgi:hydroxymethylbilane synthase
VRGLRGNVDTRLRKLAEGEYHALVLARAGLARLGRAAEGEALPELVPAPGQGCLALEARAGDREAAGAAEAVTDRPALVALAAERALVAALEASCRTPMGAHAELRDGRLSIAAFAGLPDGSEWLRDRLDGDPAEPSALGREVAERMLAAGAARILRLAERAG